MDTLTVDQIIDQFARSETNPTGPTAKSLRFAARLANEREVEVLGDDPKVRVNTLLLRVCEQRPNQRELSRWIDYLLRRPVAATVEATTTAPTKRREPVTPGVYEKDGEVYVVKLNRAKTRAYARRVVERSTDRLNDQGERVQIDYEYAPGMVFELTEQDRMSTERAKHYLVRYGVCLACGRKLKAAESVERGIGPVCAKYYGG